MMAGTTLAALGCFLWGMISVVFSPCHLASIPLIVSYVAGQEKALKANHAAHYAAAFTVSLFITIALVGIICSLLGRICAETIAGKRKSDLVSFHGQFAHSGCKCVVG
jgi:cytochrome c-type biogenesis protein